MSKAIKTESKPLRILVTGGAGFIGTNLVKYLLERASWQITVLDNLSFGSFDQIKNLDVYEKGRVDFIEGDIRDKETVVEAITGCDYVVNLAAQVGVVDSVEDPLKDAQINIMGTLNLLESAKEYGVEKFIQASSAAALGEREPPLDEKVLPRPVAPYGASKLAGEAYCSAYSNSFDLDTVVLRFSNVYGPYSTHKSSVVMKFVRRIMDGKDLVVYGDGEQTRDFIYVGDLCEGIYLALKKELENKFELFQLATGGETSINELVEVLKKVADKYGYEIPEVRYEEARSGEIERNYADISKIKEMLGFEPSFSISEGIQETMNWYVNND